jgi:hypothetical protein
VKSFVRRMNQEGEAYKYVRGNVPPLSDAKFKEVIFVGPQIRELFRDHQFDETLHGDKKAAWGSFKCVCLQFLGINRTPNYKELVNELLSCYEELGCNISLKIPFLHSHLDFFPKNCAAVSEEHGERFHQDIVAMEKKYARKWGPAVLADYYWTVTRDAPELASIF